MAIHNNGGCDALTQKVTYSDRKSERQGFHKSGMPWWTSGKANLILVPIFSAMDGMVLFSIFDECLTQSALMGIIMAFGVAVVLNILPLIIARFVHAAFEKTAKNAVLMMSIFIAGFLLIYGGTVYLRFAYSDMYGQESQSMELENTVSDEELEYLRKKAQRTAQKYYGNKVYIRGLIEISSICKNDCLYCGIRRSNADAVRYRLSKEQILQCCDTGYSLGFRTFVLQGGEDGYFTDDVMCDIVQKIKQKYPDCAVTLSLGERSYESYKRLFDSGADRYLLRHETADKEHYEKLHPDNMSHQNRLECLHRLKEIGYQTGAGFMVGSPFQTAENLADDLLFIKNLNPQMCGIGPFIPHKDTPFASYHTGSVRLCLMLISIIRLMLPSVLLPSTTALGTADSRGREKGILHGANVVMPNLSPIEHRKDYSLYDNKICTGDESAQCISCMKNRMKSIGYEVVTDVGNYIAP